MRSPKREREERERRGAVRRNVAISLRDRTKHSPSAIAEIEACTCPVRKGRAPLSLLRLSTLARSLAPSRSPVSLALLVSSSLYPSAAPVRPRNSRTFSLSVPSCTVQRFAPSSSLHSSYTLSRFYFFLCFIFFVLLSFSSSLDRVLRHLPLLFSPPYVTLYFSDLSPLLSLLLCRPSCLAMCIYHNSIFVHEPRKRRKSLYACIVYAAIAEVESLSENRRDDASASRRKINRSNPSQMTCTPKRHLKIFKRYIRK